MAQSSELASFFPIRKGKEAYFEKVLEILDHNPDLPVLPATIQQLQKIINDPRVNLDDIAEIVSLDPGLATKFIRLSQSAIYRGDKSSNILDSLSRIGMKEVRNTIMAAGFIARFHHPNSKVNWDKFWIHSLMAGRLSELIADIFRPVTATEYLAGLLHDMGKLLMHQYFPKEFDEIVSRAQKKHIPMVVSELDILGFTHAQFGAALCYKWELEEQVVEAILFHHEPDRCQGDAFLTRCVYVANALSTACDANIEQGKPVEALDDIYKIPEWVKLQDQKPRRNPIIPLMGELRRAEETFHAFKSG